jgi:hypothetical protein
MWDFTYAAGFISRKVSPPGSIAKLKSCINDWADVHLQIGDFGVRRPDRINVGKTAVVPGCAIGCVTLTPWGIQRDRLEAAAGYGDALRVGNDVRNCQRPLVSESGADKKTWVLAISDGTSTLVGGLVSCW